MSPLPLPLGRLLRSARGAGSSASRAGRGSPVRSRPRLRGLGLAGCRPGPASSSPGRPSSASFPAFSRASGRVGEGGREQRVGPCAPVPSRTWRGGGGAPPAASSSPWGTQLASFLPLSSSPARSQATAAVSLHIVRSLLPLPSPPPRLAFGLGISSLFITYFDPASLCPRFLRKFYCPRSRVFD